MTIKQSKTSKELVGLLVSGLIENGAVVELADLESLKNPKSLDKLQDQAMVTLEDSNGHHGLQLVQRSGSIDLSTTLEGEEITFAMKNIVPEFKSHGYEVTGVFGNVGKETDLPRQISTVLSTHNLKMRLSETSAKAFVKNAAEATENTLKKSTSSKKKI
jgi:hypothetical protein